MAATFDGVDDKLECADETAFDWERTSPMSFAAYVLKPSNTGNCILGKAQTSGPQRGIAFNTEVGGGGVQFSFHLVSNGSSDHLFVNSSTGSGVFQPWLWTHLAATYDGSVTTGGVKLYMNGVDVGNDGSPINNLTGTILTDNPLRVAGHNTGGGEFWAGTAAGVVADNATWTSTEVANLAKPGNLLRVPPYRYLTAAPELWLPLDARAGASAFDLEEYANNHDATIVGAPTVAADPEVLLDWGDGGVVTASFTTSTTFTKACAAPCQGMVVLIAQTTASTDRMSSVTVDGNAMTRVAIAQDTVTEPGIVYAYIYSGALAAGNHTIGVNVSAGTEAKRAWCCGLISSGDVYVAASGVAQENQANPSVTLATNSLYSGLVFNILYSGLGTTGSAVPNGNWTQLGPNFSFGTNIGGAFAANKEGANIACGWTSATDDVAMIALAVAAKKSDPIPTRRQRKTRTLTRL